MVCAFVAGAPAGFTFFLVGLDLALHPGQDVVVTGEQDAEKTLEMLAALKANPLKTRWNIQKDAG